MRIAKEKINHPPVPLLTYSIAAVAFIRCEYMTEFQAELGFHREVREITHDRQRPLSRFWKFPLNHARGMRRDQQWLGG